MKKNDKIFLIGFILNLSVIFIFLMIFNVYNKKDIAPQYFLSVVGFIVLALILFVLNFLIYRYGFKNIEYGRDPKDEYFKELVDSSSVGIIIILKGKIVYVNRKAMEMLGAKTEDDILGRPPVDFVDSEFKEQSINRLKSFEYGAKELPLIRGKIKRLDNTIVWVETRSRLIKYRGEPAIESIIIDVSNIKKIEEELLEIKTHFENIYDSSQMIIFSLDKNYRYISFNKLHKDTIKAIWGVDIEKGMNMLDIIKNPDDREKAKKNFDRALSGEYYSKIEEYGDEELKRTYYEDIYSPLKNKKGDIIGVTVFVKDMTDRIKAEKEIKKLSKIVETNPLGITLFNNDFQIIYANDKALEMGGWNNKDEVIGKSIFNFLSDEDIIAFREKMLTILKKGEIWKGELPLYKKDGSYIISEIHASAVFDSRGEIEYFVVIFSDITERKSMEKALKEAYEFIKAMFSSIPAAVFSKDREGRYLLVNEEFADYMGLTPEEVKGKTVQECWPSESAEIYHQKDIELMERGGKQIYEFSLPHKRKGKIPGIFYKACFYDAEGNVAGLTGVFLDISELKKTKLALKESEERSQAIIKALPDMIMTLNREGVFLSYHAPTDNVLYAPPEVFLNKKVSDVLPPSISEKTLKAIEIVDKTGKIYTFEYSLEINNERRWFESRLIKKGKEEFLAIIREITERKKLETQLIQSQKMETVGMLAGGIAHDFNNILTVINGYCQIGKMKLSKNKAINKEIDIIHNSAQKAAKLVSQLLAFSRKQLINPKTIDINGEITSLYLMLKRLISEDINLKLVLSKKKLILKMDPVQIEQILINLIVNAKDAIEEKKDKTSSKIITIETDSVFIDSEYVKEHLGSKEGRYIIIAVSDTGIGMQDNIKQKVFEPFFTTKPTGKGTGLGLSTVYGIVKQNNGFVYVYSEINKGTTIKIYLPEVEASLEEEEGENKGIDEKLQGKGETILIVEDHNDVRKFLKDALESLNYNVLEASDGKEAIRIYNEKKDNINLIITDIVMPEMDGKELYDRIHKDSPNVKIIFTSGYTENHIAHKGVIDKGIVLLQKPYLIKELAVKVKKALNL